MADSQIAPYGSWRSPITTDLLLAGAVRLGQIVVEGGDVYWSEGRPAERGRSVVVKYTGGAAADLTPPPFNVRTRAHEYGGGAFTVADGVLFFTHDADQRIYRLDPGAEPRPITPDGPFRYADLLVDRRHGRLICVREDHSASSRDALTELVAVDLEGRQPPRTLLAGNDFYSTPRLSPDGMRIAWLAWNHPNMPWDGTELWVGDLQGDGSIAAARLVAGGAEESIFQPEWSPDGVLYFVSDRTGWWNLYRERDRQVEHLAPMEAEFGVPQWVFGMRTYAFESPGRAVCIVTQQGRDRLARIDLHSGALTWVDMPYSSLSAIQALPGAVVLIAGAPTEPNSVVRVELASGQVQVLRRSNEVAIDPGYLSLPEAIEFPTEDGLTAHAFFYPPRNRDYSAPAGERPPLIVKSHGGPTSATSTALNLGIQFWTSRGFAVVDVNYGGSTGYGRAYRERLNGQWGVVDVDDCVNAARYLVARGDADGERQIITGGSAGGYTTLCALAFRDVFQVGTSYYGISDAETMTVDTHKFESRYLDRLIGPYPERRDLYYERSPIHFTDRLNCALLLLQGLEDAVVPPDQAEKMYDAVRAKGLPVAYIAFEGEQHGFRQAPNIKRAIEAELYFYSRVFGFELTDPIEPIAIENIG